ncbi:MAG TPA: DUF2066 domain-containing protein, partial [Hyphomicrobium sp.]|nr:DUF2066 domain-containing protein [Hyphomicrobium sp.]
MGVVAAGPTGGNACASVGRCGASPFRAFSDELAFVNWGLRAVQLKGITAAAVVLAAIGLTAVPHAAEAARADAVYTIGNYPVEASDKNAVAAKEKALADGQKAAFRALLKRIVPVTAYKQIARLADVNAANLVSGVSVRSERNSATEYIASLDFAFQADAVRNALQSQGVPYVDQQAER